MAEARNRYNNSIPTKTTVSNSKAGTKRMKIISSHYRNTYDHNGRVTADGEVWRARDLAHGWGRVGHNPTGTPCRRCVQSLRTRVPLHEVEWSATMKSSFLKLVLMLLAVC